MRSSLQFLPHVVAGFLTNVATAYLVSRVRVFNLAIVSGVVTAIAPILMATVPIDSSYWYAPFWAIVLSPINPDGKQACLLDPYADTTDNSVRSTRFLTRLISILHRLEYYHLRCLPTRVPVLGRRCLQRGISVWQLCRVGRDRGDCGLGFGALRDRKSKREINGGLPGGLLDYVCWDGIGDSDCYYRVEEGWLYREEGRVKKA